MQNIARKTLNKALGINEQELEVKRVMLDLFGDPFPSVVHKLRILLPQKDIKTNTDMSMVMARISDLVAQELGLSEVFDVVHNYPTPKNKANKGTDNVAPTRHVMYYSIESWFTYGDLDSLRTIAQEVALAATYHRLDAVNVEIDGQPYPISSKNLVSP